MSVDQPFNLIHVSYHDNDMRSYIMAGMAELHDRLLMNARDEELLESLRANYRNLEEITPGGLAALYTYLATLQAVKNKFFCTLNFYSWTKAEEKRESIQHSLTEGHHKEFDHYREWLGDLSVEFYVDDSFLLDEDSRPRWENGEHFYLHLPTHTIQSF